MDSIVYFFFIAALVIGGLATLFLKIGKVYSRRGVHTREDNPVYFWISIVIQYTLALVFLVWGIWIVFN